MSLWEAYDENDPADWEDSPDFDDCEDEDDAVYDCAMQADGNCGKAGSEECDFECPLRDEADLRLARSKGRKK